MTLTGPSNDVTVTTSTNTSGLSLVMPARGHSLQNVTYSGNATTVVNYGSWIGQFMTLNICQDSTGGRSVSIGRQTGVTIKGTFPVWTTTANKCDIVGMVYSASGIWQITGYLQNE